MVLEQFIIDADIIWDQVGKTFFENPEAKPGRIMRVQVVNAGIVEDLTGYTLNLGWISVRDPSKFGLDAFDDVDITKGIFEIEYTSGMLANIGPLNASLQLVPPGEGRPIESNNFKLTVKNSAINPAAIQGETSFSTLENALVEVNGWNTTIDGKVVAWEADMAATKQLYIDNMEEVERTYPQELVSLSQKLEHKTDKENVAVTDINKNLGKFDQTYMSDEFLQQIAGTTPVNATPADKSITTAKLTDGAVSYLKTNFLKTGKNLFDKNSLTVGYYVNYTTGALTASASYSASDWIKVLPSTKYVRLYSRHVAFYTIDNVYISGLANGTTFTTPTNCYYIRVSTVSVEQETERIEQGVTLSDSYERHGYEFKKLLVSKDNMTFKSAELIESANMFDKSAVEIGKYVLYNVGYTQASESYSLSPYIEIKPSTIYSIRHVDQMAFYTDNKAYISGLSALNLSPITTPANAKFMRISTRLTNLETQSINEGDTLALYDSYTKKIKAEVIPSTFEDGLKTEVKTELDASRARIVGDSLKNPFVRTNIRLIGDSITFGANSTDGGWATRLAAFVAAKFNKEHIIPISDKNINYYGNALVYEGSVINTISGSYSQMTNYVGKLLEFDFYGEQFSVFYTSGSDNGIFDIYVDGIKTDTVDAYNSTTSYRNEYLVDGLLKKNHHVAIHLTGLKNPSSSNGVVKIEGVGLQKTANVINSGVSGVTSAGVQFSTVTSDDDFVFCQVGTNDRHSFLTPNTTKANIIRAYNAIKAKGDIGVILMCANPVSIANDTDPIRNFRMEDVEMAVRDVALQLNTPYIDNYHAFLDYSNNTGVSLEDLVSDGLHPGDVGYKVMYDNIARNIGLPKIRDGISL